MLKHLQYLPKEVATITKLFGAQTFSNLSLAQLGHLLSFASLFFCKSLVVSLILLHRHISRCLLHQPSSKKPPRPSIKFLNALTKTPFLIADIGCVSSEENALTKFTPFLIVDSAEQVRFIIPEEKTCPRAFVDILPSSIMLRKDYYLLLFYQVLALNQINLFAAGQYVSKLANSCFLS